MASEAAASSATEGLTPAQQLMEQHASNDHHVTVEDVVDEEDVAHPPPSAPKSDAPLSEKAAGKQKADEAAPAPKKPALNTQSEEAFPALGPVKPRGQAPVPTWGKKPAAVSSANGTGANSGASTPSGPAIRGPAVASMNLPGKHTERISFSISQLMPRTQLKKPVGEIIRDINKRSKARLEQKNGTHGQIIFEATGPVDAVRESLKEIANEVGSKQSVDVPVPASVRAHIIGRQGSKIQEISKRTGARIQVPKAEAGEDEDTVVNVHIEGNALTAEMARREIDAIVNERTSTVNLRLKDIPAEFYPFLAGPQNKHTDNLTRGKDIDIKIPQYYMWQTQAPPQNARNQPGNFVPQANFPIQISGERVAAQQAQAELERRVQQLRQRLAVDQRSVDKGRHQFLVGDRGSSLHDFLEETGCSLVLPPNAEDDDYVYVVGPPDRIEQGLEKLEDLSAAMHMSGADPVREHRGPNAAEHAYNLTRYLRQRQALAELERQHEASIVAPRNRNSGTNYEIYALDGKNSMKAKNDVMGIFGAHPPSRFSTHQVDPFYHDFLRQKAAPQIRQDTGVHIVFPDDEEEESPELIFVYESRDPYEQYSIPRGKPQNDEINAYKKALQEAAELINRLTKNQPSITLRDLEASQKFHRKIEQFVREEQEGLGQDQAPVQVLLGGRRPDAANRSNDSFAIRGPSNAVDDLNAKIMAFIEQAEKDELERGHITTFDYPQKYASHLVGKGGENIQKLRQKFDVDVQIDDGKVTLKGPSHKAEACKKEILSQAKKLEDEATHILKIAPQYHRELIGAQGKQVERLQTRYGVRVNFPKRAKNDDGDDAASKQNVKGSQKADEVSVRGPKKGADEARDEILSLLQYIVDNSNTDTISVAVSQIPQLIGSGGREMENLRLTTGAQIDVPGAREGADPSGRADIKIKGTKQQVQEAKKILQERVKVFDDTVTETIDVDRKLHRNLIGGQGANIRQIVTSAGGPDNSRDLARMVRFPKQDTDGDSNTIRVEGPKSVVEKIVAAIKSQVSTLENQTTEILEVSPDKHRLLIGRGGETRRSLESQFSVQLDIPKQTTQGAARSQVKITGEPSAVEKAKSHIQELVKGQEGETIDVPRHLHHVISDNGQFFRRLRNQQKITVDHGSAQPPPKPTQTEAGKARKGANGALPLITDDATSGADEHSWELVDNNAVAEGTDTSSTIPWILRGPSENIPKARQQLEDAIKAASKPSSTGYLILPDPRSYRLVVGSGGSTINQLRKETGTKIQVPRDQAKDEAIEITGTREGCEKAREMILDIISKGGNGGRGRRDE
ncbi:hypothetical protein N0V86_008232 [Didymella sp. IMI 355093]|nr:hypothetical protein N0V86_008232 [Didymella sp. IMI 355093]